MPREEAVERALIEAWDTNQRVTNFLVAHLPVALWPAAIPGAPRRTIRMIAGHLHNTRCMWIKTLGRREIRAPAAVNRHRVSRDQLLKALARSGEGIRRLLMLGLDRGGTVPRPAGGWINLPLDVPHVLSYFVAHEAHHRGQIILVARELGHRLPTEVTTGVWQWTRLRAASRPIMRPLA